MNKINSLLFILLTSCTSEFSEAPALDGQEQGTPVRFSVSIDSENDLDSRAQISKYIPQESEVGIFAIKGKMKNGAFEVTENKDGGYLWWDENIQNNFYNAKYIAQNDTSKYPSGQTKIISILLPSGQTGTFPKEGALQFYAYYPYDETVEIGIKQDSTGNVVPQTPQIPVSIGIDAEETTDYMYTGPISSNNAVTNLSFKHALGKLNIHIYRDFDISDMDETPFVTKVSITTAFAQKGTMNLANGNITNQTSFSNRTFTKEFSSPIDVAEDEIEERCFIIEKEKAIIYSNLFIPVETGEQNLISQLTLEIQRYGETETYTFKKKDATLAPIIIEKGKTTNLVIKYSPNN